MPKFDEAYEKILELNLFTQEEMDLVSRVMGENMETIDKIIYARYGYQSLQDFIESEGLDESDNLLIVFPEGKYKIQNGDELKSVYGRFIYFDGVLDKEFMRRVKLIVENSDEIFEDALSYKREWSHAEFEFVFGE